MNKTELLWKQYEQHIGTYKFYLEILVKLIGVYFVVAGAMLSFYFTNGNDADAKLALYLPWLMSLGFLVFFSMGAYWSTVTRKDVFTLRDKLGLDVAPELGVLTLLLIIFTLIMLVALGGFSYILWLR